MPQGETLRSSLSKIQLKLVSTTLGVPCQSFECRDRSSEGSCESSAVGLFVVCEELVRLAKSAVSPADRPIKAKESCSDASARECLDVSEQALSKKCSGPL